MILDIGLAVRVVQGVRTDTARTHGCPEWEGPGIQAALIATEGPPGVVLAAALLAASDPRLDKPSANAIRMHWPKNAGLTPPARTNNIPCPDHPDHDMPCPVPPEPVDPSVIASLKAQALAAAAANPYIPPAVKRAQHQEDQ